MSTESSKFEAIGRSCSGVANVEELIAAESKFAPSSKMESSCELDLNFDDCCLYCDCWAELVRNIERGSFGVIGSG